MDKWKTWVDRFWVRTYLGRETDGTERRDDSRRFDYVLFVSGSGE